MVDSLKMTFDPMTIEHLGVRMYSTLPPVLGELIANSYDADASEVTIQLKDLDEKEIVITDDGMGMSYEDINNKFLRIGRNRREEDADHETPKGRKVIGKKGLGKLSFFGITHEIEVTTVKDNKKTTFIMNWENLKASTSTDYAPDIVEANIDCDESNGTKITLRRIQRSSNFDAEGLANALSKIFICDAACKIFITHNDNDRLEITDDRKYSNLTQEVEWTIPADIDVDSEYAKKDDIRGTLFSTEKPISPRTNMRGITLFSRKKLVNAPEYFSESASSHFYSYLTGWLEVDFIDELDEDVIGTNRQSLNWNHPDMKELRHYLQKLIRSLESDWREKRKEKRQARLTEETGINVEEWFSHVPAAVGEILSNIIGSVVKDAELDEPSSHAVVMGLHQLVPEYPEYHWRHLHPEIQDAAEADYKNDDYYRAFLEAAKRYSANTRTKSGSTQTDTGMMGEVYGHNKPLTVTNGYTKPDGSGFNADTLKNIEEGQKFLSMGVITGGRNPVSHEEIRDLRDSRLFTEKDCLDALSLLSHLQRRLDAA